jgi:ankyrin repeat protein
VRAAWPTSGSSSSARASAPAISRSASTDKPGRTPLHQIASHGDIESAELFIAHGANLDARDDEDCSTPLAFAAREGQTKMVEFLLRRGARPVRILVEHKKL